MAIKLLKVPKRVKVISLHKTIRRFVLIVFIDVFLDLLSNDSGDVTEHLLIL